MFGSRSRFRSRILKVSVSEGVVSVSNGQVSDDEVSVSDDEAETPSLIDFIGQHCPVPSPSVFLSYTLSFIGEG